MRKLDKVCRIVAKVKTDQQVLIKEVLETKEISNAILGIVKQNPERVQSLLNEQLAELRHIMLETTKWLKNTDPKTAREALAQRN